MLMIYDYDLAPAFRFPPLHRHGANPTFKSQSIIGISGVPAKSGLGRWPIPGLDFDAHVGALIMIMIYDYDQRS